MNLHEALNFAPAATYLAVVTVLVLWVRHCPEQVHLVALLVGVPVRVVQAGWADSLLAVAVAAAFFLVGVLLTARLVTGVSLFTLCVAVALLPVESGWLGLAVGLGLAGAVSLVRILRTFGKDRVNMVLSETMGALGALPGSLGQIDLDRMPSREDADQAVEAHRADESARPIKSKMEMYLPPYLLAGAVAVAAISALT